MEENTALKSQVGGLMRQPPSGKQEPERTVIVGDSLLKDLDEGKLKYTQVRYQRDGRITDAMAKVKSLPGNLESFWIKKLNTCRRPPASSYPAR